MALFVAVLLVLAACGSDDDGAVEEPTDQAGTEGEGTDPAADADSDELTTVRVGVLPIVDVAPLHLAIEEGFFEEEGLDLELVTVAGGAEAVPALVAGELDFTFGNHTTFVIAQSQGIDTRIISEGSRAVPDTNGMFVAEDSQIAAPEDLPGTTVAINTLGAVAELIVRAALTEAGVDPDEIDLTEIPFPDQPAALDAGRIDVSFVAQPFATQLRAAGARQVVNPHEFEALVGMPLVGYGTLGNTVDENPELVEGFQSAIARGTELAADDPDAVIEVLGTYTEIPEEVRGVITQPEWVSDPDPAVLNGLVELMVEHGLLDEPIDVTPFVHGGS